MMLLGRASTKYSAYHDNFVKTIFLKSSLTLKSRPKFWSLVWINIQHETVSWLYHNMGWYTSMGSLLVNTLELRKKRKKTHTSNNTISFNKPILDLEWTNVKFNVEIFLNFLLLRVLLDQISKTLEYMYHINVFLQTWLERYLIRGGVSFNTADSLGKWAPAKTSVPSWNNIEMVIY